MSQQAVGTRTMDDLGNYRKVRDAILQTLHLSPEAYRRRLCKIEYGPDYHPRLIGQRIQAACLWWLRPEVSTKEQIIEGICVEHYTAVLPFKPKNWVACHQPATLEDAIVLIEAYMSAKADHYLLPKAWKITPEKRPQGLWGHSGELEVKGTGGLTPTGTEPSKILTPFLWEDQEQVPIVSVLHMWANWPFSM